jgi:hypothetical protein
VGLEALGFEVYLPLSATEANATRRAYETQYALTASQHALSSLLRHQFGSSRLHEAILHKAVIFVEDTGYLEEMRIPHWMTISLSLSV